MREISVQIITEAVKKLCIRANTDLDPGVAARLKSCYEQEPSSTGRQVLKQILENAAVAKSEAAPLCQDTGVTVVFIEIGQDVRLADGDVKSAIHEGVRQGYREGYLRKSMVNDPFERKNTGDNTPAVIHLDMVPGDRVKLIVVPKGGGSENMSAVRMLTPASGIAGVRNLIIDWISRAGANPCPPIIAGVGIGGNFEQCALLAKKALLRPMGSRHPESVYADLEKQLLADINRLGIGPQGFGGRCTALEVFIEKAPCHIASLPVGINIQCHAARHRTMIL